jgi:TM2 domain-containing membrane protein YozV
MKSIKCDKCGESYSDELGSWHVCAQALSVPERSAQNKNLQVGKIACTHCGAEIPSGADFCIKCARPIKTGKAFCKHCGAALKNEQVFCLECGKGIANEYACVNAQQGSTVMGGTHPVNVVINNNNEGNNFRKVSNRSRISAVLFAFFLGGFGAHKFYLGKPGMGVLYIVFCWTFIPLIIAFVEFIMLLCMSDQSFDLKYNSY